MISRRLFFYIFRNSYYKIMYFACYTIVMKRSAKHHAIILLLLFCAAMSGCSAPFLAASATPEPALYVSPAPSPTPTAEPVIAVFGAEPGSSFASGLSAAAKEGGIPLEFVSGGVSALASYHANGAAAAIVYLDQLVVLPKTDLPLYIFSASGTPLSSVRIGLVYQPLGAVQAALDEAIAYPPHLAPVRMIGLFTSANSEAYSVWNSAIAKGQVFSKREYLADTSEKSLDDWLSDIFSRYFPGMLDAVYAENGALAVAAADRLASLGRDDVEVFSAGTDAEALSALSPILVCAVGLDWEAAGKRCYTEAAKLLSGQVVQSDTLSPEIFWYSAPQ